MAPHQPGAADQQPDLRAQPAATKNRWRTAVEIVSHLAVIVGVVVSVTQLVEFVDDSKRATQTAKLSALKEIKIFLEKDEEIRREGLLFVKDVLPELLPRVKEKVSAAGSGEAFYLSKEMARFAAVHYHYEQMGALVKLEYVEFPLIFEIIAFPDAYMKSVQPVRAEIAANWKGPGKPLTDLGSNIDFLQRCYELSRKDYAQRPSCPKA
jgi:hypothetical protein